MNEFYKNRRIVISGGAGFIGSHLAEKLVEYGANVTIIDNLSTGSLKNLATIKNKITFIHESITDLTACMKATQNQDIIFHMAAFISVPHSLENPEQCYETNVIGTLNLLQAAQLNKVPRFVFSSSSAVYGSQEGLCTETMTCKPESPYGHSKLMGELLCKHAQQQYNLTTIILRYFNVYGERQNAQGHYSAVVAKFKECMRNNQPITIFGNGFQTRDFIPVHKVVEANLNVGMIPADRITGKIFNIATGRSITLLTLIETLKQEFPGFNAGITFAPARQGDIKHSQADCSPYYQLVNDSIEFEQ